MADQNFNGGPVLFRADAYSKLSSSYTDGPMVLLDGKKMGRKAIILRKSSLLRCLHEENKPEQQHILFNRNITRKVTPKYPSSALWNWEFFTSISSLLTITGRYKIKLFPVPLPLHKGGFVYP